MTNHHHHLPSMLMVFLLLTSSMSSSARPLNDNYFSLVATDPILLPSNRMVLPETPRGLSACGHSRVAGKLLFPGARLDRGKYAPLVLNMLPKGPVPPSGPSKGINNLNN
ncbi:unnamed protein product [Sphenostylis stenocarpa]|uniref:Uncharacterized protein n=1 Tax=Sphenostylis stenocarpa TaxID=92480 RepID=A0AA86VVP8_9FABA|nr:unnamed protein product [Sphenostylis stenocarpa]